MEELRQENKLLKKGKDDDDGDGDDMEYGTADEDRTVIRAQCQDEGYTRSDLYL